MLYCIRDICDSEMLSNRTEGNGHKLEQEKFWLCAWEKIVLLRKWLSAGASSPESPSLEILSTVRP